jgi:hypothetical protein
VISSFVLLLAAGAVHPQVIECAVAVRSQTSTSVACADPKVDLTPKQGAALTAAVTPQCAAALLAGRAVGKVPPNKAHFMRADFEKKMAACEASVLNPPAKPKTRETVKLWD